MKIMIVDDEPLALSRLKRLLQGLGQSDITLFEQSHEALEALREESYDLLFLDIQMPNINGLALAKIVEKEFPYIFVVFQTAYDEHALNAFEVGGMDYLLKPIQTEKLQKTLLKIERLKGSFTEQSSKIYAKRDDRLIPIDTQEIFYIKADLDEVIVRTKDDQLYVKKQIGQIQKELLNRGFFRIHRSVLINVNKIQQMHSVEQSKFKFSFNGIDDIVHSSKDGAKEFREYMNSYT